MSQKIELDKYYTNEDEYKEGFKLTQEEMIELINQGKIQQFINTWDLKRLHDIDGENKDGCNVCAI